MIRQRMVRTFPLSIGATFNLVAEAVGVLIPCRTGRSILSRQRNANEAPDMNVGKPFGNLFLFAMETQAGTTRLNRMLLVDAEVASSC